MTGAAWVQFSNWEYVAKIEQPLNGFGAVIFRSKILVDGKRQYIVALQGSDGANAQDWFQNLDLAKNVWDLSGEPLIDSLLLGTGLPDGEIPRLGVIHFTGQSLGGGLAQYAAYSYVQRAREADVTWDPKENVSLVTFNGFAAVEGIRELQELDSAFDPYLLSGAQTYHYATENDIVHRLGGGDGIAPGGSWHLNGSGNSYVLDFRRFLGGNEVAGKQNYLNLVDAHRIESGFYQGFDNYKKTFETILRAVSNGRVVARPKRFSYIDTGTTQDVGARVAHAFTSGGVATESGALARLAAGVLAGTTVGPIQEIQGLTDKLLESLHRSGDINDVGRAAGKLAPFGVKAIVTGLAKAALGPAGALLLTFGTSIFKLFTSAEQRDTIREFNRQLVDSERLTELTYAVPGDTHFDGALRFRLALHQVGGYLDSADQGLLYPNQTVRETSNLIQEVAPDSEAFFKTLIDGADWLRNALRYLQEQAKDSGLTEEALVDFNLRVVNLVWTEIESLGSRDEVFIAKARGQLRAFLRADFAEALANSVEKFTAEYSPEGAPVTVFKDGQLDYEKLARYQKRVEDAAKNPHYASIKPFIEEALQVVNAAGDRRTVKAGLEASPFNDPSFNPDTAATTSMNLQEGRTQVVTVYAPYQAGPSGSLTQFQLTGAGTESVVVVNGADTIELDGSGVFEILIPEGQRQASFVLIQKGELAASSVLTLKQTIVGSNGMPTHQAETVATIHLSVADDDFEDPVGTYTILGDQIGISGDGHTTDEWGNVVNGTPVPGRNDALNGSPGNDRIEGLGGSDTVNGGLGDDHILGGDGDDALAGEGGDDRMEGGEGRDLALGGEGDDLILGGEGIESLLLGNEGNDRIYAGTEEDDETVFDSDTVTALPGDEWLDGGEGDDRLVGSAAENVLLGGAGEDQLAGGAGADTLHGDRDVEIDPPPPIVAGTTLTLSVGEVNLEGAADFLHGGGGDDFLYGEVGDDVLLGGGGDDELQGDGVNLDEAYHGGDFLDGGDGNDRLFGQGGNDALFGGAGNDELQGDDPGHAPGDDYLSGEDGDDLLIGAGGKDVLYGGDGADELHGDADNVAASEHGADELYGGEGDDILSGYGGDDLLDGGAGVDQLVAGLGMDRLLGGAGDDVLVGDDGASNPQGGDADVMEGGSGNDQLFGQGGDDRMFGGEGDDLLQAGTGNDFLAGGGGVDVMFGEDGNDELAGGDGDDTLSGEDGTLGATGGNDKLEGGAGNDRLFGEGGDDALLGGGGNDQMAGGHGDDAMDGGDGDDLLQGDAGVDTLVGGAGVDELAGGEGDDRLEGGDGEDSLFGQAGTDVLLGGEGDDYLEGGAGADQLAGGGGFDVYYWALGSGDDRIVDDGQNAIAFGAGIGPGTISMRIGSLALDFGNGETVHIEGFDPDDPFGTSSITEFRFADGTVLSIEEMLADGFGFEGTPGPDELTGTALADHFTAYEDDDVIVARAGDDQIDAGDGDDQVDAGEGNDLVSAGAGNDEVSGGGGDDVVEGGAGDDAIAGGDGDDLLDGGAGADQMAGGAGDDSYLVEDALDTIIEAAAGGYDIIGARVSYAVPDNVEELLLIGDEDLVGTGSAAGDRIHGNEGNNSLNGLLGDDALSGDDGDDILDGGEGADSLSGGRGDDVFIVDSEGDLVIEEHDSYHREVIVDPDTGETSYGQLLEHGGWDRVESSVSYTLNQWTEELLLTGSEAIDGVGTADENFIEGNDAGNVLHAYRLNGLSDTYHSPGVIVQQFRDARNAVQEVLHDAANVAIYRGFFPWFIPQQIDLTADWVGSDALIGNGGDDRLYGHLGHDWLEGGDGNDLLYGSAGSDAMLGGAGDDAYVVSGAYGFILNYQGGEYISYEDDSEDYLEEQEDEGIDTVYSEVDFWLGENFENLTLLEDTGDFDPQGRLSALRSSRPLAAIGGGNGLDNTITGNDYGNELYGEEGADVLIGMDGGDYLDGGEGADVMRGGADDDYYIVDDIGDQVIEVGSEGIDFVESLLSYTLTANVEDLWLGGEGDLSGAGNELDNFIEGNDGDNVLSGEEGDDELVGHQGDDRLLGGAGADTLDGGEGEDYLAGGSGDDSYHVDDLGDVTDETGGGGYDTVFSTQSHELGADLEALYLDGWEDMEGLGNELDNLIVGNDGYSLLVGFGGNDTIEGGDGDDSLFGEEGDDTLLGQEGWDYLDGGEGDDTLDGGEGADWMAGGEGDDVYYVDDFDDEVEELADEGTDIVYESLWYYEMPEAVENTTVLGDFQDDLDEWSYQVWGNSLDNGIVGNDGRNYLAGEDGSDVIDGRAEDDSLDGGDGDDALYGGNDAVRVRHEEVYVTFSGGEEYIYKLVPRGTELAHNDDDINGGRGNDRIDGGSGNDYLYGATGDDWIYGGDDGLVADSLADGGGGGEAIAASGSDGYEEDYPEGPVFLSNNDELDGGSGDDYLDGGSGDDYLYGGDGQDVLRGGEDGPLNTSNDDTLDGGEGIDDMAGGTGHDRYVVDGFYVETTDIPVYSDCGTLIEGAITRLWTTDTVFEAAGQGYDTVYSYADYTLTDNVEVLFLEWFSDARIGLGNDLDNELHGNNLDNRLEGGGGNDWLQGESGDDVLEGGAGEDVLDGGLGNDKYNLGLGDGKDVVADTGGGFDVVHILDHLASDDLVLSTDGHNVTVAIAGTSDRIVLQNWFGSANRVRGIVFCEDDALDEAEIEALASQRVLIAADDDVATNEDAASITGNVLGNDAWSHTAPFVANAGTYIGAYGTLLLQTDGTYSYTPSNDALQDLSVGETLDESFEYTVEDEVLANSTAAIRITIEGRNDAPAFTAASSGSVTEDAVVTELHEGFNQLYNGGFEGGEEGWSLDGNPDLAGISFEHAFDGRAAAFGAEGEPSALSQAVETEAGETYLLRFWLLGLGAEGPGVEFSASWNGELLMALSGEGPGEYAEYVFEVAAAEEGEETLLEFSFRNDPGFWLMDEISVAEFDEDSYVPYEQATQGELSFTDIDFRDGHTVHYEPQATGYLGSFGAWILSDSTFGQSGQVHWEFVMENELLDPLAEGEVLAQHYDVTVDDGLGGTATQTVEVLIHGANDGPEAEDIYAEVGEDGPPILVEADFYDPDNSDTHTFTAGDHSGIGFEDENLEGWTASHQSRVFVVEDDETPHGDYYAGISSNDEEGVYTTLSRLVFLEAGQTLSGQAQFYSLDETRFNDDAYVVIRAEDGDSTFLFDADALGVAESGDSDWTAFQFTAQQSGTYVIEAGVRNFGSGEWGSELNLDFEDPITPLAWISGNADGTFSYDPTGRFDWLAEGQVAEDSFVYTVTDGHGASSSATAWVTIVGANDAPVAEGDGAHVFEDVELRASGNVLENDSDVDVGAELSVAQPGTFVGVYGTLTIAADGAFEYALDNQAAQALAGGQSVMDAFTYGATDGLATTAGTLDIRVSGINDAPAAADDGIEVYEDEARAVGNALANDTDVDAGTVLTVFTAGVLEGAYGTLTLEGDGSYAYELRNADDTVQALRQGETVLDYFTYAATDGILISPADIVMAIHGRNDAPVAIADAAAVQEDVVLTASGNVLANDSDADADATLSATPGVFVGAYGSLTLTADGSYTYTLDNAADAVQALALGQTVQEVFAYQATDGIAATPGALTVAVAGQNDAPVVASPIADQEAQAGDPFTFTFQADAFTDIDQADVLAYSATLADGSALPDWLSFDSATRTFTGTPPGSSGGECGCEGDASPTSLEVRVRATDGHGATAFDDFVLSVTGGGEEGGGQTIIGTDANDLLRGTACDDLIDGRDGYDVMMGGNGNDVYYVDQTCPPSQHGQHGNEGVGNGEDPPPPGHDHNQNDGYGTSPGNPGSRGGQHGHGGGGHDHHDDSCGQGGQCVVDLVVEQAGQGYDIVYASADYTLTDNVEELRLLGSADLDATGNSQANVLAGNGGDNILRGGSGSDVYVHELYGGDDRIIESGGAQDALVFGAGITAEMVSLKRRNGDLVVDLTGPHGSVTIKDWFRSASKRVESIQFADGTVWDEQGIRQRTQSHGSHEGGHGWGRKDHRDDHHDRGDDRHTHDRGHQEHKKSDERDERHARDAVAEYIDSRLSSAPKFDFASLDQVLGRSGSERRMSSDEIARRWQAVAAYAQSLGADGDDGDGIPHGLPSHAWTQGGHGWGYEGSTGERQGQEGLKPFCGLDEGFRRL